MNVQRLDNVGARRDPAQMQPVWIAAAIIAVALTGAGLFCAGMEYAFHLMVRS